MANQKIKIKQITSGNQPYGKILTTDGNSGFTYTDDIGIPTGTTFPSSPTSGSMFYRTDVNLLFNYDGSRSKWITTDSITFNCGRGSIKKNTSAYMYVGDAVQSSTNGFIMKHNGTILSASADNDNVMGSDRDIEIRLNNSAVNKVTLTMINGTKSISNDSANQDFSDGDIIQVIGIANSGTNFSGLIVTFDVAWRI